MKNQNDTVYFVKASELDLFKVKEKLIQEIQQLKNQIQQLKRQKEDFIFPPLFNLPKDYNLNNNSYNILKFVVEKKSPFCIKEIAEYLKENNIKMDKATVFRQLEKACQLFSGKKIKSRPVFYEFSNSKKVVMNHMIKSYEEAGKSKLLFNVHHIWFNCRLDLKDWIFKTLPKEHWIFFEKEKAYKRRCEDCLIIIHPGSLTCQIAIFNVVAKNEEEAKTLAFMILKRIRDAIEQKLTKGMRIAGEFKLTRAVHVSLINSNIAKSYSKGVFKEDIKKLTKKHGLWLDKSLKYQSKNKKLYELEGEGWDSFKKIGDAEVESKDIVKD